LSLERLRELCDLNDIELREEHILKFQKYKELLKRWGKKINITSILDDEGIEEKHFFDSLLGLKAFESLGLDFKNKTFLDVGSGGGFPGVPLSIVIEGSTFHLCESKHKKCVFLEQAKRELKLENVKVLCSRVEDLDGKYDFLLMRAVKDPLTAIKLTNHFLEKGSILCIYRGKEKFPENIEDYKVKEVSFSPKGVKFERHFLFIENQIPAICRDRSRGWREPAQRDKDRINLSNSFEAYDFSRR
jgi:16S rRNA (guanine527-N7)-methyltransferase